MSCGPKARVSVQATGKEKGDHSQTRPITAGYFAIRPFPPPASVWLAGGSLSLQKDRILHKTSRYGAISHVMLEPMAMARPSSAETGGEEIWIALEDVNLLLGKQLRKSRAGTAYKAPATGITAHANINLTDKPAAFLHLVKAP